ncbi:hypothetical protein VZT92_015359 [Zoarces viviparus]|uniref:Uncharacterized protein n=1 Tax=Zoarces viviparus TaxID=48416 RepID=A0AAW1EZB0_ZOAVI
MRLLRSPTHICMSSELRAASAAGLYRPRLIDRSSLLPLDISTSHKKPSSLPFSQGPMGGSQQRCKQHFQRPAKNGRLLL